MTTATTAETQGQATPAIEPAQPRDAAKRRLDSLDLLRGSTVVGMIIVNASAALEATGAKVFPVLLHAKWAGFTAADLVFPAFITMVGVSIAVSTRPGVPAPTGRILWRALRLILLGLLLVNMYLPLAPDALWPPRLPGVLQRIGIAYAVAALVYPRASLRTRGIAAAVLLIGYWAICLLPIPGGMATDLYAQGANFPSWVDRQVFGTWMGEKGPFGYDPEGLVSTLPVIAQALIGTIAGELLRRGLPIARLSRGFVLAGAAAIALAIAWNFVFPIAKPIWTSPFVLVTAGITLVGLGLFHYFRDGRDVPMRKGGLLGSFGRNAIAAYTLHLIAIHLVMSATLRSSMTFLQPIVGDYWAALGPVAIFLAIIWIPMAVFDRLGWYLKI